MERTGASIVLESLRPEWIRFAERPGRIRDCPKQRSQTKDLYFEFTVGLKAGRTDATPDFSGSLVQGPAGERFVYLDIGTYAGQKDSCWSRRLKVPLSGITWDIIDRMEKSRAVLETRVPGTGKDGGPNCATVKPFDGWKLVRVTRG